MKKQILVLLLIFHFDLFCLKNYSSQTFLMTRPAYFNVQAYDALWLDIAYDNDPHKLSNFQFMMFFQNSSAKRNRSRSRRISQYFLMNNDKNLIVKGDGNPLGRNIRAEWLELPSTFDGIFSLFPQQKQVAFFLDFKHDLGKRLETKFFRNFWAGLSVAAAIVKNKLHLKQEIRRTQDNKTIIESLNRPEIKFGKFFQENKNHGFSELRFRFGTELFPCVEDFIINLQTYLSIPLEGKQDAGKIFPAVGGFNGHWGIGTLFNLQVPLSHACAPYLLALCLDIENISLFSNHQDRILDLDKKPWSRYLLLNSKDGATNIPAINVLTQCVKVEPFNLLDLSAGIRFKSNYIHAELTYGLWAHASERLKLVNHFGHNFGIAAKEGEFTPSGIPATASKSTICNQSPTDMTTKGENLFIPITESDLDLKSGASRKTMTNRINMSIGNEYESDCYNAMWALGGFVEIPANNAALEQWGIWLKFGGSF